MVNRMKATKPRFDTDAISTRCPLPPFPDGWWVVGLSKDLPRGKLEERRWMGRLIVLWRDSAGAVCVADAYCPHMGARLSPSAGGHIKGDCIRCPFHGFEYDASGACVTAPNSPPPKAARLGTYATFETAGFLFAYFGEHDRTPDWTPPAMDEDGWSETKVRKFPVFTHPQDVAENSVDMNHLLHVHGWMEGRQSARAQVDGRHYTASFSYRGQPNLPLIRGFGYETEANVHVWGLGFVYTESNADNFGMSVRNWFLASPIDGEHFEAYVGVQTQLVANGNGAFRARAARHVLRHLFTGPITSFISYEAAKEFSKDIKIWNHRRYLEHPILCASDGELHKFRRYCQQFYS